MLAIQLLLVRGSPAPLTARELGAAPFQIARPSPAVPHCGVSSGARVRELQSLSAVVSVERALDVERTLGGAEAESALPLEFDEVFRRYAPYVGALVLKLIGRPGDVDDVVQDVFI
ncbi:MAG TPA: hypothetical protein VFQ61_29050, partial [Polyangiaceae bacterium]|nr:hypothetical protein [Polyangiaceae bacterium]